MASLLASRKPVWITLAATLLFHTVLLSLQTNRRFDTSFVQKGVLDLLSPIESIVDRGFGGIGGIWNGYIALIGLHKENAALLAENQRLQMEMDKQREGVLEAERLRHLMDLPPVGVGKTVAARVIGRETFPLKQTLRIDKGSAHGIGADTPVITPEGIVGRVLSAGNAYSIVQLLTDADAAVGVMVRTTRRQALLKGNGGSELDLDYIDDDNDLKEGDEFVTSGLDRIYPKGYSVGTIVLLGERSGLRQIKAVRVRPSVALGSLEEVLCIIGGVAGAGAAAVDLEHPPAVSRK